MNIRQISPFKYNIGEEVILKFDPLSTFGMEAVVVQQIKPLKYPVGSFDSDNLKLLPRTRREYRSTRELSYLVKIKDTELNIWATEMCLDKWKVGLNGKTPDSKSGTL